MYFIKSEGQFINVSRLYVMSVMKMESKIHTGKHKAQNFKVIYTFLIDGKLSQELIYVSTYMSKYLCNPIETDRLRQIESLTN